MIMNRKSSPLHIALLSYEYPPETGFGGIGTYTYYHARALAKLGHRVHVFAGAAAPKKETAVEDGVIVTRFKTGGRARRFFDWCWDNFLTSTSRRLETALSMYKCFREVHRQDPFDVVEMPECGAEGLIVNSLIKGIPKVLKFHSPFYIIGSFFNNSRLDIYLTALMEGSSARRASVLMAPSTFMAERVRKDLRLRDTVHVVFNGIDFDRIDGAKQIDIRRKYGIPHRSRIVASSGRIDKLKGTELFLDIVPLVVREEPEALFVFAGNDLGDGMTSSILRRFQELGVSENVLFVGKLDFEHLMNLLKTADLFAYPSRMENCPYAILEAMVCRCPIVASSVGGLPQLLDEGRAGALVSPDDASAFAREILSVLNSKERADMLAGAARRRVEKHYDDIRVARETLRLYARAGAKSPHFTAKKAKK